MKKNWIILLLVLAVLGVIYLLLKTPAATRQNDKGLVLFDASEYVTAEKHFSRALLWKRNFPEALINLVKSQLAQEKIEPAKINWNRLRKISPEQAETYALNGQILAIEKSYDTAIGQLSLALEKDSLLAYAWFYRAISYANLGRLEEAAADYLKAQEVDQSNTEALKAGAIVFSKLDNFEAAIRNYNILLELDPSNIKAYLERANFKQKIGDLANAISDFDQVIELDPARAEAFFERGKCYARMEQYEKAIADFSVSAGLNYKIPGSLFNSGLSALNLNRPEEAKSYFEKSISADKDKELISKSLDHLGVIHMMQQNNTKALVYFNRSIEADANYADAYYNRGIAYGMQEKYELALYDLEKALQLGKASSDVYFALGIQKINLRDTEEGCKDLATAASMGHIEAANMQKKYCKKYMK